MQRRQGIAGWRHENDAKQDKSPALSSVWAAYCFFVHNQGLFEIFLQTPNHSVPFFHNAEISTLSKPFRQGYNRCIRDLLSLGIVISQPFSSDAKCKEKQKSLDFFFTKRDKS
jgi:hypothetical protein